MSSKINQPSPFPVIVKPDQNVGSIGTRPAQTNERLRPQHSSSSTTSSKRRPAPLELPKPKPVPFAVLEMEKEDLSVLQSVMADQVTYEITQLYSVIENISKDDNALEIRQGLKALEEQVRLREHIHAKRTIITSE